MKGKEFKHRGGNGQHTKQQLILYKAFENIAYSYKVDLAIVDKKIAIEVDGKSHLRKSIKEKDEKKTKVLNFLNWKVVRFTNTEIDTDLSGCLKAIENILKGLDK